MPADTADWRRQRLPDRPVVTKTAIGDVVVVTEGTLTVLERLPAAPAAV